MKILDFFGRAALLAFAFFDHGCMDVTSDRAQTDLGVGHATLEGTRLDVDGGHAAVRRLEPGYLEVWANAPALKMVLRVSDNAPREWSLRVRNVLSDAQLSITRTDGTTSLVSADLSLGTERNAAIEVEPGSEVTLTLEPKDLAQRSAFDFIEFGDVQRAIDRVGDVFSKMNEQASARFVMMAGDITQSGTKDELERFQSEQRALRIPIFVTLGNHELGDSEVPYHRYFGRGSQSFRFHGVQFTSLDSASATIDPIVYDWLDGWIDQGRGGLHLVFAHIPPLDPCGIRNGAFSSRAEADKFLMKLARGKVTATFYGHVHTYYSFENAGIPAFISGGGGAIPERFDGIGRHFLLVHVDPSSSSFSSRVVRVD